MRIHRLPIVFLVASLAACYAQLEDSSVQITHSLCTPSTTGCIPGGGVTMTTFAAGGANTFKMSFGDLPLLKSSDSVGPTTVHTTLGLNQTTFDMQTSGGDFTGITDVQLVKAPRESTGPGDDPCPGTANCPVIAIYTKATDGTANQQIVLKSQVKNLIDLIDATTHEIILEVQVKGQAPNPPLWSASMTMDLAMQARANFP